MHESRKRSLIINCLNSRKIKKDHHKTWLIWNFHSQEKNVLAVKDPMIFLIFVVQKLPSRLNKPINHATDMRTLTGMLADHAWSQWAIPRTFGIKEKTTGLPAHFQNAAV